VAPTVILDAVKTKTTAFLFNTAGYLNVNKGENLATAGRNGREKG
jgi:hypothetical protein